MKYTLIMVKVEDYDKWKPVFDEHSATRKAGGEQGGHLFRDINDNNEIVIMLRWDTMENAKKFFESEDLKKAMQKAGVVDKPNIYFLEEVETIK